METFADFIVKLVDLFNAEFAVVRKKMIFFVLAIAMVIMAAIVAAAGFVLVVIGIYQGLCLLMSPFLAAFLDAILMFIVGGGLLVCARVIIK